MRVDAATDEVARLVHRSRSRAWRCYRLVAITFFVFSAFPTTANACDELVSRVMLRALRPVVQQIDCGPIAKAGLDRRDHHLDAVCYTSAGPTSRVEFTAVLSCSTSDGAVIKAGVSDKFTGAIDVRAADCTVTNVVIQAAGDLGKAALRQLGVEQKAKDALNNAVAGFC